MRATAVATVVLSLVSPAVAQDMVSGNYWLDRCKQRHISCLTYVTAMVDMNDIQPTFGNKRMWCAPQGATVGQALRIISVAMEKQPNQLHRPFYVLATVALVHAFPCTPDKQR